MADHGMRDNPFAARASGPRVCGALHGLVGADTLKPGNILVIYEPDRIARSMKELLVLLGDELHARDVNLEIPSGICAGLHRPNGQTIADKMLFMVAAMAAERERDLIHERTMDGLATANAQGRFGGRPAMVDGDTLAITRARQARGESVTSFARHLGIGRSTLYRALAGPLFSFSFADVPQLRPARANPPQAKRSLSKPPAPG
jgi:hypothetical protein